MSDWQKKSPNCSFFYVIAAADEQISQVEYLWKDKMISHLWVVIRVDEVDVIRKPTDSESENHERKHFYHLKIALHNKQCLYWYCNLHPNVLIVPIKES